MTYGKKQLAKLYGVSCPTLRARLARHPKTQHLAQVKRYLTPAEVELVFETQGIPDGLEGREREKVARRRATLTEVREVLLSEEGRELLLEITRTFKGKPGRPRKGVRYAS